MATTALPDPKAKRYDRQIRIWGAHGQARLEACRIALLNCGPTGSETLKNLVLGGIGSFTIVDGHKITASDLGNNFFVDANSLGEVRAKVVTELLQELNESVSGSYVEEAPEVLLEHNPGFFQDFDLVIATQMREQHVLQLEDICRLHGVKLLVVRSYGLAGYLRISMGEHTIIESKPDSQLDDLRLHQPWPELVQYAASIDLSKVDDVTHRHIPYAVLLLQASAAWHARCQQQEGSSASSTPSSSSGAPSTSKERSDFKDLIRSMRRTVVDGVPEPAENFDEALKAAYHVWTPYSISSEVRTVLDDDCARQLSSGSDDFWIIVAALKAFVDNEGQGCLPLEGSIPDMTATTELYLRLQQLYRERAERDVSAVEAHVRHLLASVGRDQDSIGRDTIKLYCKNARNLRVVRYRRISEEATESVRDTQTLRAALAAAAEEGASSNSQGAAAALYVLLRAADRFYAQHSHYPGTSPADSSSTNSLDDDVAALKTAAAHLLVSSGVASSNPRKSPDSISQALVPEDCAVEMVRYGAGELHVVAAFMGGVAAQEAIKIVSRQFVPVSGTLIYNAINCTVTLLDL